MKKCKGNHGPHYYDENKNRCPECNAIWFKEYRKNNPEIVKRNRRTTHFRNHEENKQKLRDYGANNKERKKEYDKIYREENSEKIKKNREEYKSKYPEKVKSAIKNHYENNKHVYIGYSAKRRTSKRNATPNWFEKEKIEALYEKCKWLECLTGIKYEVDHIIPINNENVCGLHVWANLQILDKKLNRKKSNYFTY